MAWDIARSAQNPESFEVYFCIHFIQNPVSLVVSKKIIFKVWYASLSIVFKQICIHMQTDRHTHTHTHIYIYIYIYIYRERERERERPVSLYCF